MGNGCSHKCVAEGTCVNDQDYHFAADKAHTWQQQASMMGCKMNGGMRILNKPVGAEKTYERAAPLVDGCGRMHVVICALNYGSTRVPLESEADGQAIENLAKACGADSVHVLHDNRCTRENVAFLMKDIGMQCDKDDYVIFFFSGRTTRFTDTGGKDRKDGEQVLCFVDQDGQVSPQTFVRASELSDIIAASIPQEVRVIMLTECPHIADVGTPKWQGREAISLSGSSSKESRIGAYVGGGAFTHSILLAIERLQKLGEYDYSVGMLYNTALEECARVLHQRVDFVIQPSAATACHEIAWPLIPQSEFKAPLSKLFDSAERDAGNRPLADAQVLASYGIRPQLLNAVRANVLPARGHRQVWPRHAEAVEAGQCTCM